MALHISALVVTAYLLVAPIRADCQANVATATHVETGEELEARLTVAQRQVRIARLNNALDLVDVGRD